MEYVTHRGVKIPLLGFGTWTLGDDPRDFDEGVETFVRGIDEFEMGLIDTAEMYGLGRAEKVVSKILARVDREKIFLIDKILPGNAQKGEYLSSCKRSLKLLGTSYLDLYLLHWKAGVDLQDMVNQMEMLVRLGLIKRWGVSNFDTFEMEELFACDNGNHCFCNQCLYNIATRGPEFDLIPWCTEHDVLFMAYSPLLNNGEARREVTSDKRIMDLAQKACKTPESLLLSFVIRNKNIVTAFKTSSQKHLLNNLQNVFAPLTEEALNTIDELFPKPKEKQPLLKL